MKHHARLDSCCSLGQRIYMTLSECAFATRYRWNQRMVLLCGKVHNIKLGN